MLLDTLLREFRLVVILAVANIVLLAIVAWLALKPEPVIVVPGLKEKAVLSADTPEHGTIRDYAILAVLTFEDFKHTTIEGQDAYLLHRVSHAFTTQMERVLEERRLMVKESKMSSSLAIDRDSITVERASEKLWQVTFIGFKEVLVAGKLSWSGKFEYKVAVTPGHPTSRNPSGLYLAGLAISKVEEEKKDAREENEK